MKLYFMKKEALDILKSNLDIVYNMYFTEKDNKWLWNVCGGNPFVEFKEIQDFQLAPIGPDMSKGEVEFDNCKIIYEHLSFLTESQACDERLWAGMCHSVYYSYLRKDGTMIQNLRKIKKRRYQISNRDFSFLVVQDRDCLGIL